MFAAVLSFALLSVAPSAQAADRGVSVGAFGGALFTPELEVLGDTVVLAPRVGYWPNRTVGVELDLSLMPFGQTQDRIPESFPYFAALPAVSLVGRLFEEEPFNLVLSFGVGPFIKNIDDGGALGLPDGTARDVDFAAISGPGIMIPFGSLAFRTEYRWLVSIGSDSFDNRGAAFLHGMWTAGLMYLPNAPKDTDKDGIYDEDDACFDQAEDLDEFEDLDGCPDLDNDKDGVNDVDEGRPECALQAEDLDGFEDDDGCPDLDNDQDEIQDEDDACPDAAGTLSTEGCPDADGDLVRDSDDECPEDPGTESAYGCVDGDGDRVPDYRDDCPEAAAAADVDALRSDGCPRVAYITEGAIKIVDKVYFASGSSRILRRSDKVLDAVVSVLERLDGIRSIQVEGHTDSSGNDDSNLSLSEKRAQAVVDYLAEAGVESERLVAKGFGETRPVADNETSEGREANRRVEFNILEQGDLSESEEPEGDEATE